MEVLVRASLVPGTKRVDLSIRFVNRARDHRMRLLFPTGGGADLFEAASTLETARRGARKPETGEWKHPPPDTFIHHGWIAVNGLVVLAPGLPEGEVLPDGTIAVTLVRAVGDLSRMDLRSRPEPAGPWIPTPGAQCLQRIDARLSLVLRDGATSPWRHLRDFELGLWAVVGGDRPPLPEGAPVLSLEPGLLHLSAVKPAESSRATIVRVLNPTGESIRARIGTALPIASARAVRLDETPMSAEVEVEGNAVAFTVPAGDSCSVAIEWAGR